MEDRTNKKIEPKTRKQLAEEYGLNRKTIYKWLHRIGITGREILTPKQVEYFYSHYGQPG